jgi:hypothetical protein
MKKVSDRIIYWPSDLIRDLASPFASWLDRYNLENPGVIMQDEPGDEFVPSFVVPKSEPSSEWRLEDAEDSRCGKCGNTTSGKQVRLFLRCEDGLPLAYVLCTACYEKGD